LSIEEGNPFSDSLPGGGPKTLQTVTPAQAEVYNSLEILDPRFRGDDEWASNGVNLPLSDRPPRGWIDPVGRTRKDKAAHRLRRAQAVLNGMRKIQWAR